MTRDEATRVDLERAARLAHDFARRAAGPEAFEDDLLVQSAVLHQRMVLGESVKRLSAPFRSAHTHIPWSQIARMRTA